MSDPRYSTYMHGCWALFQHRVHATSAYKAVTDQRLSPPRLLPLRRRCSRGDVGLAEALSAMLPPLVSQHVAYKLPQQLMTCAAPCTHQDPRCIPMLDALSCVWAPNVGGQINSQHAAVNARVHALAQPPTRPRNSKLSEERPDRVRHHHCITEIQRNTLQLQFV